MEGFGSADLTTPFHYGSGQYRSDSLELKLKKQYWKTKQTVIQKLGKNQDQFIVAGDAEIDTKLEVRAGSKCCGGQIPSREKLGLVMEPRSLSWLV